MDAMRLIVNLLDGLRRVEHDNTNFRSNFGDILVGLEMGTPNVAVAAPFSENPTVATEVADRSPLSIVDSWLVKEIENVSLPSKIKTTKLLERFNDWAGSNHQQILMTDLKKALDPYQHSGMFWKHTNTGKVYCIDLLVLRNKFCQEDKIDALLDDSE